MEYSLRPYRSDDAEKIVSWLTSEHAFALWSAGRYDAYPLTAENMNSRMKRDETGKVIALTMTDFGRSVVGHLLMRFFDERKEDLRFFSIIVDSALRGRGLGTTLLQLAEAFALDTLNAKRITISVFAENAPALACYDRLGYRLIGEDEPAFCLGKRYERLLVEKKR